jgi:uncharacterized protein
MTLWIPNIGRQVVALGIALASAAPCGWAGYQEGAAAYRKGDFATAMKEWLPAARKGNRDARFGLGVMHANGEGTGRDPVEAVRWYRLAAHQGHALAQNNLCVCYMDGLGVEQNLEIAETWCTRAAEKGEVNAHRNLGWIYAEGFLGHRDWKKAERHYRAAAEKGDAVAQWRLGQLWLSGKAGVSDDAGARRWIQKSAENGNAEAQNFVGMSLEAESPGARNVMTVLEWYGKAAEQGLAKAQSNLARLYRDAEGVADSAASLRWLRRAAAQDDVFALLTLSEMYLEGSVVQQDIALGNALRWMLEDAVVAPGTEAVHRMTMALDPPPGCRFGEETGGAMVVYMALVKPGKFEEALDRYLAGPRPCAQGPRRPASFDLPLRIAIPP